MANTTHPHRHATADLQSAAVFTRSATLSHNKRATTFLKTYALQKILAKVWSFFAVQAWPNFESKPFIRATISRQSARAREGVLRGAPLSAIRHY
jgi:hypothetical protein